MVLNLPERLMSIVQYIPRCYMVVDVGTDHALLPIYLIEKGIAEKVIAGDLKIGPLDMARKNIAQAGLTDRIYLRQGNGLEIIEPGEADVAVIAGMGGSTIRQILMSALLLKLNQLVMQPMGDSGILRNWLVANGWRIDQEDLIREDGRLYEIISAVPGQEKTIDPFIISVGPRLFEKKHPLLIEVLKDEADKNLKILTQMAQSTSLETQKKRTQILDRNQQLERVIKCL